MGLVHIYCGDGKGKTTCSVGLAVRMAGSGKKVLFSQFFKDGSSSEIKILNSIENIDTIFSTKNYGLFKRMTDEQKAEMKIALNQLLNNIIAKSNNYDMIVLDEIISTYNYGMVDTQKLVDFIKNKNDNLEIVLTGRNPANELIELADYLSEIKKVKHPFDNGIVSRKGIEF